MAHQPSRPMIHCPNCQNQIPADSYTCLNCSYRLRPAPTRGGILDQMLGAVDRLTDWLNGRDAAPASSTAAAAGADKPPPITQVLGARRVMPAPRALGALVGGRYRVTRVVEQPDCTYYDAEDAAGVGHRYLLRETASAPFDLTRWPQLPGLCVPVETFSEGTRHVLALAAPQQAWQTVDNIAPPVDLAQTLEWTLQIGHALRQLGPAFGPPPPWPQFSQAIILAGQARISDLSVLGAAESAGPRPDQAALAALLGRLRYDALTAGGNTPAAGTPDAAVLTIIDQARAGRYPTLRNMLTALQQTIGPAGQPHPAAAATLIATSRSRPLRQSSGAATDTGRTREHNEDSIAKFDYIIDQSGSGRQVGLYMVADGIGGYAGGEIASQQTAAQALSVFIEQQFMPRLKKQTQKLGIPSTKSPEAQLLTNLVQTANDIVYRSNQAAGSEHGSTITVALVIGDRAYVANAGDSRTYLLRNGQLKAITEDHSLVYRLYQAGQITYDEIYTHEKKNLVFRSLGEKPTIEVDLYDRTLQAGDRLLLCSDGLWEMVRDDQIAAILHASPEPNGACDRLVDTANRNGGLDNISAIVVDLV